VGTVQGGSNSKIFSVELLAFATDGKTNTTIQNTSDEA